MFSKNEARPMYNAQVLKEAYEHENRNMQIYDRYVANPRMTTLAGKFYAKHEFEDLATADTNLMNILKDHFDRKPIQKYPRPLLESHVLGWYGPLIPIKKGDRRFYVPRVRSISLFITPIKKKSGK